MARKFSHLAKEARERYKTKDTDMTDVNYTSTGSTVKSPPMAKKATHLIDADGNVYLWTPELAERGDLVAAYDPTEPEKHSKDRSQIALNRELEIAREKADAEEVARIEAVRKAEEAERVRLEAEELAKANAMQARQAEEELQREREEHARQLAEMQAQVDALAKQSAESKQEEAKVAPKKAPKKKAEKEAEQQTDDLGNDFE